MLDVKALLTKMLNAIKVDYIIEQGTSGIWTYRKWNSGLSECWGVKPITWNTWSQWGSFYYISSDEQAYPTGLFTSVYSVQGSLTLSGADTISSIVSRPTNLANTAPKIVGIRPNSGGSVSGYAFWNTAGRWK